MSDHRGPLHAERYQAADVVSVSEASWRTGRWRERVGGETAEEWTERETVKRVLRGGSFVWSGSLCRNQIHTLVSSFYTSYVGSLTTTLPTESVM